MTESTDDDWTVEDDRLVLIGQIAELIETMPIEQLEDVLANAKATRSIFTPYKTQNEPPSSC